MIGYGEYWTAGFTACQWRGLFYDINVTEFDLIHIGVEYDRVMRSYGAWFHLLGLRFWLSFGWASPPEEVMAALTQVAMSDQPPRQDEHSNK